MPYWKERLNDVLNYRTPVGYTVWVREDNLDWILVREGFAYAAEAERWARRKVGYRRWQVRRPIENRGGE